MKNSRTWLFLASGLTLSVVGIGTLVEPASDNNLTLVRGGSQYYYESNPLECNRFFPECNYPDSECSVCQFPYTHWTMTSSYFPFLFNFLNATTNPCGSKMKVTCDNITPLTCVSSGIPVGDLICPGDYTTIMWQ